MTSQFHTRVGQLTIAFESEQPSPTVLDYVSCFCTPIPGLPAEPAVVVSTTRDHAQLERATRRVRPTPITLVDYPDLRHNGLVWRLSQDETIVRSETTGAWISLSRGRRRITIAAADERTLGATVLHVVRLVLDSTLPRYHIAALHGALLDVGGRAVMIAGESGAGKTTLQFALLQAIGACLLSFDSTAAWLDGNSVLCIGLPENAGLHPDSAQRLGILPLAPELDQGPWEVLPDDVATEPPRKARLDPLRVKRHVSIGPDLAHYPLDLVLLPRLASAVALPSVERADPAKAAELILSASIAKTSARLEQDWLQWCRVSGAHDPLSRVVSRIRDGAVPCYDLVVPRGGFKPEDLPWLADRVTVA